MTDVEWAFFEPFLTGRCEQGGRPPRDHRRVLDGVFWIARTGAPWRDLPEELGNWNSVWRQFRRWSASGLWRSSPNAADRDTAHAPLNPSLIQNHSVVVQVPK